MASLYKKITFVLSCVLLWFNATAQTQPKNHWELAGSVGYAFSLQDKTGYKKKDLQLNGDTVIGYVPGNYREGTSNGFNIDAEAIYQKKSGWYNVLGLQAFVSLPSVYFVEYTGEANVESNAPRYKENSGYAMLKLGLGYRTQYKRNANLFMGVNVLYGGGWYKSQESYGYSEEWVTATRSTYFNSFLLGLGVNAEVGTLVKLSRKMEGTIKAGYNAAMFSVWDFAKETGYNCSRCTTGEPAEDFFNINFSLGIRYTL